MKLRKFCLALVAGMISLSCFASVAGPYNYIVTVLPPFSPVLINSMTICPDPVFFKPWCVVNNQRVNGVITIRGQGQHACYLIVQADGSVQVDQTQSVFCTPQLQPAKGNVEGKIVLPTHF